MSILIRVVLPAPFGPNNPTISPCPISRLKSCTALTLTRFGDTNERRVPRKPGSLRAERYSLVRLEHDMTDSLTVPGPYHTVFRPAREGGVSAQLLRSSLRLPPIATYVFGCAERQKALSTLRKDQTATDYDRPRSLLTY